MIELTLPFPPTVNHYYLNGKHGSRRISEAGQAFRKEAWALFKQSGQKRQEGHLALFMTCFPKDKRRRDLDNLFKSTLDALQHAGAYDDDSQIVALSSRWEMEGGEIQRHPQGQIHVRIVQSASEPLRPAPPLTTECHTDHPMRVWDRTCPACNPPGKAEFHTCGLADCPFCLYLMEGRN